MPARPNVPGAAKFEVLWTQAGVPAANVLHARYPSGGPAPTSAQLAAAGQALWTAIEAVDTHYNPDTSLVEVIGTDLASSTGAVGTSAAGWTGSASGAYISAGSAIVTSWKISNRYRGGHPRTYWPAPTQPSMESPSDWNSATVGAFETMSASLLALFSSATIDGFTWSNLAAVSYFSGGVARVAPVIYDFTGSSVNSLLRSQRRRITASTY